MVSQSGEGGTLDKLRPVGCLERYSIARDRLGFYTNVAVSATYILPAAWSLPTRIYVYKACEAAIGQHPILSAVLVDEDAKEPYFARLPEIHLDQCVSFTERKHPVADESDLDADPQLDELLNLQHNTAHFAPRSALWRLCILTDPQVRHRFTAVFVFHHALGDGMSGKAFHKTFLRALHAAASCSLEANDIIPSSKDPLFANMESIHPMPVSIPFLLTVLFKEKVWNRRDPHLWTGSKVTVPLKSKVRHFVISQPKSASLKDRCRQRNTTITAAVQTIVALAVFKSLPSDTSLLFCDGVISTRRWTSNNTSDDSMGVFVQGFTETYSRDRFINANGSLVMPWDEAARSKETIQQVLRQKGKNANVNLLKYVSNYEKDFFLPKVGKDREASYEVSNLGFFDGSDLGRPDNGAEAPRIGRMVFSQSANVTGPAFEVSVATGGDGCLTLSVSWQQGVVDDAFIERVIGYLRDELNRADEKD